jgi:hypothetical protein
MFGSSDACIMYYFYLFIYLFLGWNGTKFTITEASIWRIVPVPDDDWWWVWGSRWNFWQGKPKYFEKTYHSSTLSTTNPTWPVQCSNLFHRVGKPATNCLSYCTAYYFYLNQHVRNCMNLWQWCGKFWVSLIWGHLLAGIKHTKSETFGCSEGIHTSIWKSFMCQNHEIKSYVNFRINWLEKKMKLSQNSGKFGNT